MIKYGIVPLSKNIEKCRENEENADLQYIRWI